jgi:tRNA pseudouridine55 synthase
VSKVPSREEVLAACASFVGRIEQQPPSISAIKVDGVPAYKRARRGQRVALDPRVVRIDWLHVHAFRWPELDFEMGCGRGTYVRSLIRDLGKRLGTGGCLTSLARRRVGPFTEEDAWSFDAIQAATGPEAYLIDLDRARKLLETNAEGV